MSKYKHEKELVASGRTYWPSTKSASPARSSASNVKVWKYGV